MQHSILKNRFRCRFKNSLQRRLCASKFNPHCSNVFICDNLSSTPNLFSGSMYAMNFRIGVSDEKINGSFMPASCHLTNRSKLELAACSHSQALSGDKRRFSYGIMFKILCKQNCWLVNEEASLLTRVASSLFRKVYNKFIALQSLWPHTIMWRILFTTQPNSNAAGSQLKHSSWKCCACGTKLPAFRTAK